MRAWARRIRSELRLFDGRGAASWGGGAVDGGSVNAFLAAALTRVMRAAVPIPDVASASVLHSVAVVGSVVGVVGHLYTFGELNSCELGVFRFEYFLLLLLRLLLNKPF